MHDDAMYHYVDRVAREIAGLTRELRPSIDCLTALSSFKLKPERTVRDAATRLRDTADLLDDLADRFPQPRVMEAAE